MRSETNRAGSDALTGDEMKAEYRYCEKCDCVQTFTGGRCVDCSGIDEIYLRARNDALLHRALREGRMAGLSREEALGRFVLILLDIKDELFQDELERRMNSVEPFRFLREAGTMKIKGQR